MSRRKSDTTIDDEPPARMEVKEVRTPCPICGSTKNVVIRTVNLPTTPWFDREKGVEYPGRIQRRRRCEDCGQVFLTNEGKNNC